MAEVPARAARVAVVVSQLGLGGAERQTTLLLEKLAGSAWAPRVVVCLSGHVEPYGPRIEAAGYRVVVLERRRSFDPGRLLRLRALLRREAIDLIHAVHMLASGYCALASAGGRARLVPTARGTVVPPHALRWFVYRAMLRRAPVVLANSHRGAEFLCRRLGARPGSLRVVPNGIDFGGIRRAADRGALRTELGLAPDVPVVAWVGKNNRVKNVPRLASLLRELTARHADLHAVIAGVGLGPEARAEHFAGLPEDRVHLLGPRSDVPSILAAADALVLTSDSEGCPNVVLESLAIGRPVVAPDVGDVRRMIGDDAAGAIVGAPDDIPSFADAVLALIGDRSGARSRVIGQWPRLESEYGLEAMVRRTLEAWKDALGARSGAGRLRFRT